MDSLTAILTQAKLDGTCKVDIRTFPHVTEAMYDVPAHRVGILHLAMRPRFVLADCTGVGKTPQAIAAFCYLHAKAPNLKAIVVTKASAVLQWLGAVRRFTTLHALAPGFNRVGDREVTRAARYRQWQHPATVMVTSYQKAARDLDAILDASDQYVLIVDEAHTLRGGELQQVLFPAVQRLSLKARYAWALSATPIYGKLEDLHAVFESVWPGFFGSLAGFQAEYLVKDYNRTTHRWITRGTKNVEALKAKIAPYILQRPAEAVTKDLPALILDHRPILLGPVQRAFYTDILNGTLRVSATESKALHRDAIGTYCQIAADIPSLLTSLPVPSAKVEALDDLLDEAAGDKVLVWSRFEKVVTFLADRYRQQGREVATITGSVPALTREKSRQRFQTVGSGLDLMLIDSAGGEALDLQAAKLLICFDLPWSWGELTQILGRTRRIGSLHPHVRALLLIAPHTSDAYVYMSLTSKQYVIDSVLSLPSTSLILPFSKNPSERISLSRFNLDLLKQISLSSVSESAKRAARRQDSVDGGPLNPTPDPLAPSPSPVDATPGTPVDPAGEV